MCGCAVKNVLTHVVHSGVDCGTFVDIHRHSRPTLTVCSSSSIASYDVMRLVNGNERQETC